MSNQNPLNFLERILKLGAPIQAGEGSKVFALFYMLFMLMVTAYILKPVREELILIDGGSEVKSYATALQAIILLFLVPIYSRFSRKYSPRSFMLIVTLFCAFTFFLLAAAGYGGFRIAIIFYLWMGAYGLLVISQFWAYASEFYNESDGKRLFGLVAFGASLGAMFGSILSKSIPSELSPYVLLSIGATTLCLSSLPVYLTKHAALRSQNEKDSKPVSILNAFRLIKNNRYLIWIAVFSLLVNWVNSLGEYLISYVVEHHYDLALAAGNMAISKNAFIREFYSDYFLAVNICGVLIQFFAVSRCIKYFGVRFSLLVIPAFTLAGYSLLLFFPVIFLFKAIKIIDNSLDYSLLNTVKQILYLPTSREERYEARAVIETICVRSGDILQGITVFIGINVLMLQPKSFLWFIIVASIILFFLARIIGTRYQLLESG